MPVWIERLLQSHAPSLPLHRHRWFARDLHQFLAYCRSRGQDKLDLDLLAREYVETLCHSEPALETWKIEQARQALDVFARGVEGWRWEHDPEKGEWAPRFRIRSATEPKGGATEMGVSNGSTAATVPLIERMQLSCYVSQVQCVQDFSPAERASKKGARSPPWEPQAAAGANGKLAHSRSDLSEVRSNYNNSHYCVQSSDHGENDDIIGSTVLRFGLLTLSPVARRTLSFCSQVVGRDVLIS
jgi:hypothetical protein